MSASFDAGGLITTETASVDLGHHHGIALTGLVHRRILRLGLGRNAGLRIELARARPVSVTRVVDGQQVVHRLPANPDPWIVFGQRLALIATAAWLLTRLARRS